MTNETQGADGAGTKTAGQSSPFGDVLPDHASEIATQVMNLPWTRHGLGKPGEGFDDDGLCDRHGDVQIIARNVIGATPAPAATPGVPDSLRALLDRARTVLWRTGPACPDMTGDADAIVREIGALIAAQPAGQAGDTRQTITVPSPFLVDASTPNSTRTGAAETELREAALTAFFENESKPWHFVVSSRQEDCKEEWRRRLDRVLALAARPEAPSDSGWRPTIEVQREVAALRDQAQANLAFYEAHGSDVALLESSRAAAFEEVLSLFPRQAASSRGGA